MSFFPEPYTNNTDDLKNVPSGLNSFKSKVDKLDIRKLEIILIDSNN